MTISFTRTRDQLATLVLRKLGVVANNATAASADTELVFEAIDMRLKEIHKLGIFWRKVTSVPTTFSLTSSIISASAGAGDILFPMKVTYTNGSNDDPVQLIGIREYAAIEDKGRIGNPEKALWRGGSEFFFYPVPGANGTAKLLYERIADDTSAGAAIDVDVAMLRSVANVIAYDMGDLYDIPEQKMQRWKAEAAQAERDIRKLSVQRIDYDTVAVDDYDTPTRRETDYGR